MYTAEKLSPRSAVTATAKELRIAWSAPIRFDQGGRPIFVGTWIPDNSENRYVLEMIVEAGIEAYGLGTHWIQQRDA